MSYHYNDPERETDPHALPDVEVFFTATGECPRCTSGSTAIGERCDCCTLEGNVIEPTGDSGWYYAFGFPGCLWDGSPMGPFESEKEALAEAQQQD